MGVYFLYLHTLRFTHSKIVYKIKIKQTSQEKAALFQNVDYVMLFIYLFILQEQIGA